MSELSEAFNWTPDSYRYPDRLDMARKALGWNWNDLAKLFETTIVKESFTEWPIATPEQLQEIIDVFTKYPHVTLQNIAHKMKADSLAIVEKLQY